jgi:hypothetical protein
LQQRGILLLFYRFPTTMLECLVLVYGGGWSAYLALQGSQIIQLCYTDRAAEGSLMDGCYETKFKLE